MNINRSKASLLRTIVLTYKFYNKNNNKHYFRTHIPNSPCFMNRKGIVIYFRYNIYTNLYKRGRCRVLCWCHDDHPICSFKGSFSMIRVFY